MCGIVAIVPFRYTAASESDAGIRELEKLSDELFARAPGNGRAKGDELFGGDDLLCRLHEKVCALKTGNSFFRLFSNPADLALVRSIALRMQELIRDTEGLASGRSSLEEASTDILYQKLEKLKDIAWCISAEVCDNVEKTKELAAEERLSREAFSLLGRINTALNSLDRLEVRGRDSAGLSIMVALDAEPFERFCFALASDGLEKEFEQRVNPRVLSNRAISYAKDENGGGACLSFVYKVASEIGSLGDNVRFLRSEIREDSLFHHLLDVPFRCFTISGHTRWASVGTITEANCHPLDSMTESTDKGPHGPVIHACLNGDIDNFQELAAEHESAGQRIAPEITTDTKIIPVRIASYLKEGNSIEQAFRLAVRDFKGSHAISMNTCLAPGKMFFAQKGSGQALFIGVAEDHYIVSSELYGIVEETSSFVKMNAGASDAGQIVVLDYDNGGGAKGIKAFSYDGTSMPAESLSMMQTEITSRDVDRQEYPHYFLKEISEAPASIAKTLHNRWKPEGDGHGLDIVLGEDVVPSSIKEAIAGGAIRRILFIGQGTAGVAAMACADIFDYYLSDPSMVVCGMKSSELSGFDLVDDVVAGGMNDTLVCAISQSGTTTDTNRAVDMAKKRGAATIAIVNRRDSDITFKVDGVLYTSTGRDIEMSVASTKAFYSQVVAGSLLGLYIAKLRGSRNGDFITEEIRQLLRLPSCLGRILEKSSYIEKCARRFASTRTYWAVVGSGPNKAAADEIRIKLSELCYKTISSDFVEDKKHIDLSAEPLIIVCAAGARARILDDIVKDTAIFKAHKAVPIVIADEGEERFAPYAEDVIYVPPVAEHFGPVINTFTGHLWGYYAALSINEGARMLHEFRDDIQRDIENYIRDGLDLFEIVLENRFKEKMVSFYATFRAARNDPLRPVSISMASDLALLFKYLAGRLPLSDFELDFGKKGTAPNMLETFFSYLGESINRMARPIDAIKHQAKTVTVGTSRVKETMNGILFEALARYGMDVSQLTNSNVVVLKNVQPIISEIKGAILYEVHNLNLLGEPTDETTISIVKKDGVLASIPSRVETDNRLKGTKKIIVREGNVYLGRGRKDDRNIVVIPVLSSSPSRGGRVRHILLLNVSFREDASLFEKKKALGGKCERIKNIVQESSVTWQDGFIELVETNDLFGNSAEKIAEAIVAAVESGNA